MAVPRRRPSLGPLAKKFSHSKAVRLGVAAALCGLPAVPAGDTEAPDHEAGGGPSGNDADAAPDSDYHLFGISEILQQHQSVLRNRFWEEC